MALSIHQTSAAVEMHAHLAQVADHHPHRPLRNGCSSLLSYGATTDVPRFFFWINGFRTQECAICGLRYAVFALHRPQILEVLSRKSAFGF